MQPRIFALALTAMLVVTPAVAQDAQAELDAACQAAREKKLEPKRRQLVEECVQKGDKSREECARFYADWDGRIGDTGARMFFDLPECEKALDHQRSSGRR